MLRLEKGKAISITVGIALFYWHIDRRHYIEFSGYLSNTKLLILQLPVFFPAKICKLPLHAKKA